MAIPTLKSLCHYKQGDLDGIPSEVANQYMGKIKTEYPPSDRKSVV